MPRYETHYLEDLEAGQTFETPARTVTETAVEQFAMVSGDWVEHHTNQEYAEETMYGDRIAHGLLVASIATGLLYQSGVFGRSLSAVTELDLKFPNATYLDDTISGELDVIDTTEEGPFDSMGIVPVEGTMTNQHGAPVCLLEADLLIKKRAQTAEEVAAD
jgi:acyl dehydratase